MLRRGLHCLGVAVPGNACSALLTPPLLPSTPNALLQGPVQEGLEARVLEGAGGDFPGLHDSGTGAWWKLAAGLFFGGRWVGGCGWWWGGGDARSVGRQQPWLVAAPSFPTLLPACPSHLPAAPCSSPTCATSWQRTGTRRRTSAWARSARWTAASEHACGEGRGQRDSGAAGGAGTAATPNKAQWYVLLQGSCGARGMRALARCDPPPPPPPPFFPPTKPAPPASCLQALVPLPPALPHCEEAGQAAEDGQPGQASGGGGWVGGWVGGGRVGAHSAAAGGRLVWCFAALQQ